MTTRKKAPPGANHGQMYLRLYVSGSTPNSLQAIRQVRETCEKHFPGAYTLEILDLAERPGQALEDGVVVTPTLLRIFPPPLRRVIGNLSDTAALLLALNGSSRKSRRKVE